MAGCVVAHIGIFLSVILWIPVVNSSFGSRHPFLSILIFFIMFAVISAITGSICEKIDFSIYSSRNDSEDSSQISPSVSKQNVLKFSPQIEYSSDASNLSAKKILPCIKYTEESIHAMDWREFELFIAQILREHGYVAHVTPATSDGGKDIIARSGKVMFYIECKHWKKKSVGREELQKLVGAAASSNIREIIFITSSNFTDTGISYKYELNRIGKFHLQLWSMRDILTLANHTDFSFIRPLRTLKQRQDRISARDDFTVYYSFGHPSNRCSISIQYGNIYIDDQNRFSHMPCQYFHITKAQDFSLSNIFFEEIRNPERPDLICFYTEKRGRLGDLRIIGCYGGRIQELFNPYVGELDGIGENCTISIKYVLGETFLVVSGSKNTLSIKWNGSEYILG